MSDLLKDFQKGASKAPSTSDTGETRDSVSLLKSSSSSSASPSTKETEKKQFMTQFFKDVEIVKKQIAFIGQATVNIKDINQRVTLATTTEKEQDLSEELKPLLTDSNKKATIAKTLLQKLREDTERLKSSKEAASSTSDIRIRENLVNTLTRKFVEVMKEYQTAQQRYKQDIKKKVTRQVQIVKPDATTEEIDAVMKTGGTGALFQNSILKGDAADSISTAFMNAKDKYQDVLTLEASVAELHQMFLDFAMLTEQQGEMLDQIEFQVKSASDFVDEGNVDMTQAVELQKELRKRQLCFCILALAIIGALIGVIYAYTGGSK